MHWLKTSPLPACLLSAAAAATLAVPGESWAQVKPASNLGARRPTSPRPTTPRDIGTPLPAPGADAVPPSGVILAQGAAPASGETDVQRELRRLYEESGREMPQLQQETRLQRPLPLQSPAEAEQPSISAPPTSTNGSQASAGGPAPVASSPKRGSQNPIVSFFKRLTGGQSKPQQTSPPAPPSRPAAPPMQAATSSPSGAQPSYTPYSGQQPRRLPGSDVVQTLPPSPPAPSTQQLPPPPVDYPPIVAAPPQARIVTTTVPPTANPQTPAPKVAARSTDDFRPFDDEDASPTASTQPAAAPNEPSFAPPLIVESLNDTEPTIVESPFAVSEPAQSDVAMAPPTDAFPDPFPEMSEDEADDEMDVDLKSPFVGLKLDEEPDFGTPAAMEDVASTATPAETPDPFAELTESPAAPKDVAAPVINPMPLNGDSVASELPVLPTTESGPELPALEPAATGAAVAATESPLDELPDLELPSPDATADLSAKMGAETPTATETKPVSHQPRSDTDAKMALIRDRGGMKGLKGFCPVTLRDDRELLDAQQEFSAAFRGQKSHFATEAAQKRFEADPGRYVPAAYGADVVVLIRDKDVAEGSLDFAAWYKGKLYLFSKAETHDTFVNEPAKYATPAGLE